jgi:hypothetical protein
MKIILTENKRDRLVLNWLNKEFGNLTKVVRRDKTFYIDKDRFPLFFYNQDGKNRVVYVSYYRFWTLFESIFGMNHQQIKNILKEWLEETYNLRGYTPAHWRVSNRFWLEETYNLK